MTLFFWLAALLLCGIASTFVAWPLLYKLREDRDRTGVNVELYEDRLAELGNAHADGEISDAEFETLKSELQKNLLAETANATVETEGASSSKLPIALALVIPLVSIPLYVYWGALSDVELSDSLQNLDPGNETEVRSTVAALAERMESQPENDQGWFLVANAWLGLEAYDRAAAAFAHLKARYPQDENIAANYAETLYMANNGEMTGEVRAAIDTALRFNPQSLPMLELKGMHAFRSGELGSALDFFNRALQTGPPAQRAQVIERAIGAVETVMAQRGETPPLREAPADATGRSITVTLGANATDIPPEATVFVFARAVDGPPMPLAVQRLAYSDLPLSIRLDESMAMLDGVSLANFDRVEVVARVSLTGDASAAPAMETVSDVLQLDQGNAAVEMLLKKEAMQDAG